MRKFWTAALFGLCMGGPVTAFAQDGGYCEDQRLRPLDQFGQIPLPQPQSQVSDFVAGYGAMEESRNYAYSEQTRLNMSAVGRLDVALSNGCMQTCTATALPGGQIITAGHCFGSQSVTAEAAEVFFGHLSVLDTADDVKAFSVDLGSVSVPDMQGLNSDVAIARLKGPVDPDLPTARLSHKAPLAGQALYIVGHPSGLPQTITRGACRGVNVSAFRLEHRCDTAGGSSGSPIFSDDDRTIIAIHTDGVGSGSSINANRGTLIAAVADGLRAVGGDSLFAQESLPQNGVTGSSSAYGVDDATLLIRAESLLGSKDTEDLALPMLQDLYSRGSPRAAYWLGRFYALGRSGIEKDPVRAYALYEEAAAGGDADGKAAQGQALLYGTGTGQDESRALGLLREAACDGSRRAMRTLADREFAIALELSEVSTPENDTAKLDHILTGLDWLKQAALVGDHKAAELFSFQAGWNAKDLAAYKSPEDPQAYIDALNIEANGLLQTAANDGCTSCLISLGNKRLYGEGVAQNTEMALELYSQAADAGEDFGYVRLGVTYFDGAPGLPKNYTRAASYFLRTPDQPQAMEHLGWMYYHAEGVEEDLSMAKDIWESRYRQTGNASLPGRQVLGGISVIQGDPVSGFAWYVHCAADHFRRSEYEDVPGQCLSQARRLWADFSTAQKRRALQQACALPEQYPTIGSHSSLKFFSLIYCPGTDPNQDYPAEFPFP